MGDLWNTALCGTAFGAALTYSGVFIPEVIISQMRLESFHMMKVFLTATASSAVVLSLPEPSSHPNITARSPNSLPYLGRYAGNVLGGLLVGFGMTLAGACPGTMFVQVGTGVPSSLLVLAGTAIGAVFHQAISGLWRPSRPEKSNVALASSKSTIHELLGCSKNLAVAAYVTLCSTFVCCSSLFESKHFDLPPPVVSGLLIGGVQALSVLSRGRALGVSGVFSDTGKWFWELIDVSSKHNPHPGNKRFFNYPTSTQTFATGLVLGSLGLSLTLLHGVAPSNVTLSTARALGGGFCLAVGALMGGGCTSGHGISGMAMLGISSVISVASMFAGGITLALLT